MFSLFYHALIKQCIRACLFVNMARNKCCTNKIKIIKKYCLALFLNILFMFTTVALCMHKTSLLLTIC